MFFLLKIAFAALFVFANGLPNTRTDDDDPCADCTASVQTLAT
jgi:hypothetical protein